MSTKSGPKIQLANSMLAQSALLSWTEYDWMQVAKVRCSSWIIYNHFKFLKGLTPLSTMGSEIHHPPDVPTIFRWSGISRRLIPVCKHTQHLQLQLRAVMFIPTSVPYWPILTHPHIHPQYSCQNVNITTKCHHVPPQDSWAKIRFVESILIDPVP